MAKKTSKPPTRRQLERKMEKLTALLRATIEKMKRSPHDSDAYIQEIEAALNDYILGMDHLLTSNAAIRTILLTRCATLRDLGYDRREIRSIERLLDHNAQLTDDWMEKDGIIAYVLTLLVAASMKYRDLVGKGPIMRR